MRQAVYALTIDGQPVTAAFAPVLISLEIELVDGGETDRLTVVLDDSNGQIELPRVGAGVSASLGWSDGESVVSFEGFTDEPKSGGATGEDNIDLLLSSGDRSSGRTLTITAHSADLTGRIKQPQQGHLDNTTFAAAAQQWGQKAGLSVSVAGALASVQRAYWGIANESYMAWAARTAKELGATFKVIGSQGVFLPRAGGTSASGAALTGISATWGVNLISFSIAPVLSRPNFGTFATRWWDAVAAQWKSASASGTDSSSVTHTHTFKAPDQDQAQSQSQSNADESRRGRGGADTVTIDGEPAAQPTASCAVSGVRPGVDGSYVISRVRHQLSRASGFLTSLAFVQPDSGAGTDSRDG